MGFSRQEYWSGSSVLIQLYTEILDRDRIEHVCETIEQILPEALYAGCSSNGNIVNGDEAHGVSVTQLCGKLPGVGDNRT